MRNKALLALLFVMMPFCQSTASEPITVEKFYKHANELDGETITLRGFFVYRDLFLILEDKNVIKAYDAEHVQVYDKRAVPILSFNLSAAHAPGGPLPRAEDCLNHYVEVTGEAGELGRGSGIRGIIATHLIIRHTDDRFASSGETCFDKAEFVD